MAIGTHSDFQVNDQIFNTVYLEELQMNAKIFNDAAHGAITLTSESVLGDFERDQFLKEMSQAQMIKHRDPNSLADLTPESLSQIEKVGVKLNRTIGPVENTMDMFKKIGQSTEAFSVAVAKAAAMAQVEDQAETIIATLMGSIQSEAGMVIGDGLTPIAYEDFPTVLATFGDKLNSIKCLVMHSSTYYSLMGTAVSEKLWNIAGESIRTAANPMFGYPVIVIDTDEFAMAAGKGILFLTEGAGAVVDSETATAELQRVLGKANITMLYQGETAYNVRVKGYSFTDAGISPVNAVLKDPQNWAKISSDIKNTAGAIFNTSI